LLNGATPVSPVGYKVSVRVLSVAVATAFLLAGVGGVVSAPGSRTVVSDMGLRMYDPAGRIKWEVRTADIVRLSARATRQPGGSVVLYFRLTKPGASKFHKLTRALAHRGAELRRAQRFALEVAGRVVSRPLIDYHAFPDGFDVERSGIQIEGMKLATAQRLARQIRQG
jgi:hypothetical protein